LLASFAPLLSPFFRAPLPPSQNLLAASISRDIQILSFPLLLSYFLWTLAICFVCCCYSSSELFFSFFVFCSSSLLDCECLVLYPRVVKLSSSDSCLWYPSVPLLSFIGFLFWSFFFLGFLSLPHGGSGKGRRVLRALWTRSLVSRGEKLLCLKLAAHIETCFFWFWVFFFFALI
jgi:hypothetical protein